MAILVISYVIQQRWSPFLSAGTLSTGLKLSERDLAQRLHNRGSVVGKGSGDPKGSVVPVSVDSPTPAPLVAAGGGQGGGDQGGLVLEDVGATAGSNTTRRAKKASGAQGLPGAMAMRGRRASVAVVLSRTALFAKSALQMLTLAVDYNHLVSRWHVACKV